MIVHDRFYLFSVAMSHLKSSRLQSHWLLICIHVCESLWVMFEKFDREWNLLLSVCAIYMIILIAFYFTKSKRLLICLMRLKHFQWRQKFPIVKSNTYVICMQPITDQHHFFTPCVDWLNWTVSNRAWVCLLFNGVLQNGYSWAVDHFIIYFAFYDLIVTVVTINCKAGFYELLNFTSHNMFL